MYGADGHVLLLCMLAVRHPSGESGRRHAKKLDLPWACEEGGVDLSFVYIYADRRVCTHARDHCRKPCVLTVIFIHYALSRVPPVPSLLALLCFSMRDKGKGNFMQSNFLLVKTCIHSSLWL